MVQAARARRCWSSLSAGWPAPASPVLGVRIGVLIDGAGIQILMNDRDFAPAAARQACLGMALLLTESGR